MKKTALALVVGLLSAMFVGALAVNLVTANPIVPQGIELYSPESKVYPSGEVEMKFVCPRPGDPYGELDFTSFRYSLDGRESVPVSGNTTLTGLSWGSHSLVVTGEDDNGNTGSSQIVYFDVYISTSWIALIAIGVVALVLSIVGLKIYRRSRNR